MNIRCLIALPVAAGIASMALAQAPAGNADTGRKSFYELGCAACHGTVGQGGGIAGPRVAPNVVPYAAFVAQLREPADKMPRYTATILSDVDAADLYAFLHSVPPARSGSQVELLKR